MMDNVTIVEQVTQVSILEEGLTVEIVDGESLVIEVGIPGPSGAPGTGSSYAEEILVDVVPPTDYTLLLVPLPNSVGVFINGLRQSINAFSVSGATVMLPDDLELVTGDVLLFTYSS